MKSIFLPRSGRAGLILATTLLLALTGCDPYFGMPGGYGGGYNNYAPAYGRSNYSYYPRYSTYYHPQTQMYHYHNGSSWVSGPRPYSVTPNVFHSSPFVPLYLPSHPQYHHSNVVRTYPHTWVPSGGWNSNHRY